MTIGSVLARIGEIQSRFGFSTSVGSPHVDAASFSGLGVEEIVDIVTGETAKIAGQDVAGAVGASLLDALSVQRSDAGVTGLGSTGAIPVGPRTLDRPAVYPVDGYSVGSPFGPRTDPIDGTPKIHKGVDIGAPTGTPINAAAAGTVVWAGPRGTYGNLVVIRHDDRTETRYAHQSTLLVQQGDVVSAGQTIGEVGSTGRSTGPHVHFEARVDGEAVDPIEWIQQTR